MPVTSEQWEDLDRCVDKVLAPKLPHLYPDPFTEWKRANAHIVSGIFDLADSMRARGHAHWSIRAAFHVIRWRTAMSENPEGAFKLNNKWSADLARWYNQCVGYEFFRTRDSDTSL